MDIEVRMEVSDLFATLGFDVERDAELTRGYLLLSIANSCFSGKKPVRIDVKDGKFCRRLEKYYSQYFPASDIFSDEKREITEKLIDILSEEDLFKNYRYFFDSYSPFIVDWNRFHKQFSGDQGIARMLLVLAIILTQDDNLRKPFDVYSQFDPIADLYKAQDDFTNKWLSDMGLSTADYLDCWDTIFSLPYKKIPVRINGRITNAIDKYRSYFVPLERLLEDYYLIKTHLPSFDGVINPWAYIHKGIRKIPVELGVSVSETLFELAAYPMKDEKPTDVIRSLFYPKSVSDSDFECNFLLPEFYNIVTSDSNVLVVHPSPDLIIQWNKLSEGLSNVHTVYAVPNDMIAQLYQMEFPAQSFISFKDLSCASAIDYVLMTPRNLPPDLMYQALQAIDVGELGTRIIGLFPNVLFDEDSHSIRTQMLNNCIVIERMILVSSHAVASSPRKKVVMYLQKGFLFEPGIKTWYLSCWGDKSYYISKEHFLIPLDDFFDSGLSIKSLFARAIRRKKTEES